MMDAENKAWDTLKKDAVAIEKAKEQLGWANRSRSWQIANSGKLIKLAQEIKESL